MFVQMPLKIGLRDDACFETFVTEQESLAVALNSLQSALKQPKGNAFYLFAESGAGKTHLLQAACRYVTEKGQASVYLPMNDSSLPLIPDVLIGLERTPLVCLDDMEHIIGNAKWELALANLLTKSSVQGHNVILAGEKSVVDWSLATPELTKALMNVLPIKLSALNEKDEIIMALQRHAKRLGFELPVEVGNYLIKQFSNDLQELLAVLQMLEQATLVEKRRLTLPFVKKVLGHS
ncbi:DnaA regulatory inactivator Hda [Thiomicrorhabdus sp. ZW0627]|uniref:DnaA regulatory inactivator Hda n=1 Tax=Thiomicrorhabdus sp. ZW0627 TaxID=3039774 RepID=UPI002437458A|nr:DnaA regulatory inactivator Hda [Thiomicrorhabdus sp. ZW0627]MDG6773278.1 DnaA regulatory inactivator Hda [Thiomicrorhabdus sp. ZW0627]